MEQSGGEQEPGAIRYRALKGPGEGKETRGRAAESWPDPDSLLPAGTLGYNRQTRTSQRPEDVNAAFLAGFWICPGKTCYSRTS